MQGGKFLCVLRGGGDRVSKTKLVLFLHIGLLVFMTYPQFDSTCWVLDAGCGMMWLDHLPANDEGLPTKQETCK